MNKTLAGKVALVTGASSGIGEYTALMLAEAGTKIAAAARRMDRLEVLVKKIIEKGGEAKAYELDVTNKVQCATVTDAIIKDFGKIDILVNNSGVMLLGPVVDADIAEWERMIDTNVKGLMYMTHAALPQMKKQGSGHIVNISSVAGRTTRSGSAVYNSTKWGVNAFTEALRQELVEGKSNIRTTLIEPGAVDTELRLHNRPEIQEEMKKRFSFEILQAEDIAAAILYAVSQPARVNVNEILIRPTEQLG